jgi:hypothetical protein
MLLFNQWLEPKHAAVVDAENAHLRHKLHGFRLTAEA